MNTNITIKGIHEHEAEKSKALRNYIEDHLKHIDMLLKYVQEPVHLDITLDVLRTHHHHVCDVRIHGPHGFEIIVKKEDPEMYKAIDRCLDVVNEEIVRYKQKQVDAKKTGL